jgi:hypothetical protein
MKCGLRIEAPEHQKAKDSTDHRSRLHRALDSAPVLRALYSEDDAKQLLKVAKAAGFTSSARSGQKVTISGFTGNGPDEMLAWRELKKSFSPLHIEVSTIGRDSTTDRRSRLHRALDCVLDRKVAKDSGKDYESNDKVYIRPGYSQKGVGRIVEMISTSGIYSVKVQGEGTKSFWDSDLSRTPFSKK